MKKCAAVQCALTVSAFAAPGVLASGVTFSSFFCKGQRCSSKFFGQEMCVTDDSSGASQTECRGLLGQSRLFRGSGKCGACPPETIADDFINRAFDEGGSTETTDTSQVVETDEGIKYEVAVNITTRKGGILSLADVEDLIQNVICEPSESDPSRMLVDLAGSFNETDLIAMFPIGALLVVNKDVFGVCFPGSLADEDDFASFSEPDLYKQMADTGDGYLVIESVALQESTVVVTGSRGFFFSLFDVGSFTIVEVEETDPQGRASTDISFTVSKSWQPLPFIVAEATGTGTFKGGIKRVEANFESFVGFDMTLTLSQEFLFGLEVGTKLRVGAPFLPQEFTSKLASIGISPPPIKVLQILKLLGMIEKLSNLPEIDLGLYFECLFVLQLTDFYVEQEVGPKFTYDYTSGRKETEVSIIFKPLSVVDIDATVTVDEEPNSSVDFAFNLFDEPRKMEVIVFAGVRPQMMLYATEYIAAGVSVDSGCELSAVAQDNYLSSLPLEPVQVGPCNVCHKVESTISTILKGPKLEAYVKIPSLNVFGFGLTDTASSIVQFSQDLAIGFVRRQKLITICIAEEYEETIPCGDICCDGSRNAVCLDDSVCCYKDIDGVECCNDSDCSDGSECGSNNRCIDRCNGDACCRPGDCATGGVAGDPHLITFDNLAYSCQGRGEFVLVESSSGLKVHAAFEEVNSVATTLATFATALAVQYGSESTAVQIFIPRDADIVLLINGSTRSTTRYEDEHVSVDVKWNGEYNIFVKSAGVSVNAGARLTGSSRHFAVRVIVPLSFSSENELRGLLGNPDGLPMNDWMTKNGTSVPIAPSLTGLQGRAGFEYCLANWCIKDDANSLFKNPSGLIAFNRSSCDEEYSGDIDISTAAPEILELCGSNLACLIDGVELGRDGAQSILESEAMIGSSSLLQIRPALIFANASTNLIFTMDLRTSMVPDTLEAFDIFQINPLTLEVASTATVRLVDLGLDIGDDTKAKDLVYSNTITLASGEVGETFSFQAVPVLDGVADPTSLMVVNHLNAVRVFSLVSGISPTFSQEPTFSPVPIALSTFVPTASSYPTASLYPTTDFSLYPTRTASPTSLLIAFSSVEGLKLKFTYTWLACDTALASVTALALSNFLPFQSGLTYYESLGYQIDDTQPVSYIETEASGNTETVTVQLGNSQNKELVWKAAFITWLPLVGPGSCIDTVMASVETDTESVTLSSFKVIRNDDGSCAIGDYAIAVRALIQEDQSVLVSGPPPTYPTNSLEPSSPYPTADYSISPTTMTSSPTVAPITFPSIGGLKVKFTYTWLADDDTSLGTITSLTLSQSGDTSANGLLYVENFGSYLFEDAPPVSYIEMEASSGTTETVTIHLGDSQNKELAWLGATISSFPLPGLGPCVDTVAVSIETDNDTASLSTLTVVPEDDGSCDIVSHVVSVRIQDDGSVQVRLLPS